MQEDRVKEKRKRQQPHTASACSHRRKEGFFSPSAMRRILRLGKMKGEGAFTCLLGLSMDCLPPFPCCKGRREKCIFPLLSSSPGREVFLPQGRRKVGGERCVQSRTRRIEASSGIAKQNCKGGKNTGSRPAAPCRDFHPSGIILRPFRCYGSCRDSLCHPPAPFLGSTSLQRILFDSDAILLNRMFDRIY